MSETRTRNKAKRMNAIKSGLWGQKKSTGSIKVSDLRWRAGQMMRAW